MEFMIGTGVRLPERHDHAKPEGRPRAAGHDLVLSDREWHGGDVMMTADLYRVHDGTDVTATVAHLNAVGPALDGEMAPRHVERLGIRELEVVDFDRLGFPGHGRRPTRNGRRARRRAGAGRKTAAAGVSPNSTTSKVSSSVDSTARGDWVARTLAALRRSKNILR
jgi:hypothetical protein